jgi:alpha-tubulin suppressor-like RCC1 family protein
MRSRSHTIHRIAAAVRRFRPLLLTCLCVTLVVGAFTTLFGVGSALATSPGTGTLYAWGGNTYGEVGDGTQTQRLTPEEITLAPGVTPTAIAANEYDSMAIGSDDQLYAWGQNADGQLGDGTQNPHDVPEVITLGPGVSPTSISAGVSDSLAIGSNGDLYAWGDNFYGQLGDGTTTDRSSPELITLAPGVSATAVAAGAGDSFAVGSNGDLYAWGLNNSGQLGDGTTTDHLTPEVTTLAPGVSPIAVAAGSAESPTLGADGYTLAIGSDGKLYAWGDNTYGELGDGTTTARSSPESISLGGTVSPTSITAGGGQSLVIGSDGKLYGWGYNSFGQLGDGNNANVSAPEVISLAPGVEATAVSASVLHTLAIGSDGNLYAFGSGNQGQLGNGCTCSNSNDTPEVITLGPGVSPTAVATGNFDTLAIGSSSPPPNLPETPLVVAFPVLGASLFGVARFVRRRRPARVPN